MEKSVDTQKIPKKIYQSWKTKKLDGRMAEIVEETKKMNPDCEYYLYDDNDCKQFLLEHFGINHANAFDVLIPGAFKCDFWRYAQLYITGGIYMDMDMQPLVPFSQIIEPNDELVSIADLKYFLVPSCNVFQSFLACTPRHPALLYAVQLTFANIVTRRHELLDSFSITGPVVMGIAINLYWNKSKTHESIEAGQYGSIKLLSMSKDCTFDLNGKQVFKNKFSGYDRGANNYARVEYYKDEPRRRNRVLLWYLAVGILVLCLLGLIFTYFYRKKWGSCKKSLSECSARTSSNEE